MYNIFLFYCKTMFSIVNLDIIKDFYWSVPAGLRSERPSWGSLGSFQGFNTKEMFLQANVLTKEVIYVSIWNEWFDNNFFKHYLGSSTQLFVPALISFLIYYLFFYRLLLLLLSFLFKWFFFFFYKNKNSFFLTKNIFLKYFIVWNN